MERRMSLSSVLSLVLFPLMLALLVPGPALAKRSEKAKDATVEPADDRRLVASTLSGLALRELGPGIASGRVIDLAVDQGDPKRYFVAVASGGVWKTVNAGTT